MSTSNRPRIYLAGPAVFLRDACLHGQKKKTICEKYGLEGMFPVDTEIAAAGSPRETALVISKANEALIRSCTAMIADMTPFRGVSADVGTAYEMGYGRASGLMVFAYTNVSTPFTQRTASALGVGAARDDKGCLRDSCLMAIEEWGMADNLMLEGGVHASGAALVIVEAPAGEEFTYFGGFEKCVQLAAGVLLQAGGSKTLTL
ncbi:MAG TPA: nucleoside 2-deoxyribosyltransferase [Gemmataceae bacterium]|nr:nucleoside 2-deoxyribosyltransferase [Gemmataceae bacterium]